MQVAYLSFIGPTNTESNSVEILGLDLSANILSGTKYIRSGQLILAVCSRYEELLALYVISNLGKPYQIYGQSDLLLDRIFLKDITKLYSNKIKTIEYIILNIYKLINVNDLQKNKKTLLYWEEKLINSLIKIDLSWEQYLSIALNQLEHSELNDSLKINIKQKIKNLRPPSKQNLECKYYLDI